MLFSVIREKVPLSQGLFWLLSIKLLALRDFYWPSETYGIANNEKHD